MEENEEEDFDVTPESMETDEWWEDLYCLRPGGECFSDADPGL
jgi:hypothetical protein